MRTDDGPTAILGPISLGVILMIGVAQSFVLVSIIARCRKGAPIVLLVFNQSLGGVHVGE